MWNFPVRDGEKWLSPGLDEAAPHADRANERFPLRRRFESTSEGRRPKGDEVEGPLHQETSESTFEGGRFHCHPD